MFCSKCGATVAEGATHCPACGQPTAGMAGAAAPYGSYASAPPMSYAGFWLRFVAALIDGAVICIVATPIFILLGGALGLSMSSIAQNPNGMAVGSFMGGLLLFEGCIILGVWLYYALLESSAWQGTIGKKVLGLRVTDLEGQRVSFGRATGRFFGKIVSNLTFYIGYIMAGFTEKKQALHDMIAGCLVLKST